MSLLSIQDCPTEVIKITIEKTNHDICEHELYFYVRLSLIRKAFWNGAVEKYLSMGFQRCPGWRHTSLPENVQKILLWSRNLVLRIRSALNTSIMIRSAYFTSCFQVTDCHQAKSFLACPYTKRFCKIDLVSSVHSCMFEITAQFCFWSFNALYSFGHNGIQSRACLLGENIKFFLNLKKKLVKFI